MKSHHDSRYDEKLQSTLSLCQGHSSLMLLVSWILLQKIPSPSKTSLVPQAEGWLLCWPATLVGCSMFTWDDSTPKTLSTLPTNQLKVSLGVRAATLCTIEILTKSSCWTSPNTGMITMRGKGSEARSYVEGLPRISILTVTPLRMRRVEEFLR